MQTPAAAAAAEWRLVLGTGFVADTHPDAARGALNMAVDETLLESVQRGSAPVLRFYTWNPPCLSLGRNQAACGLYDVERAAAAGIDIVRRPTGGLGVLHDRELTYCVAAPLHRFGGPRAAYSAINRALVEGLRRFGIAAEQADGGPSRRAQPQSSDPCFQTPSAGEVVVEGRKLVGSAQRCERGAVLQHGSILLAGSQARVLDLLAHPATRPQRRDGSITLAALIGHEPPITDLVGALCRGFEEVCGTRLAPGRLDQRESARAQQLAGRYAADHWTWRR